MLKNCAQKISQNKKQMFINRAVKFKTCIKQIPPKFVYPNCNVCAPEFAAGVNLRRHDTSTPTIMNVIFC